MTINTDFLLAPYNADKLDPVIPFDKIVMNIERSGKVLPVEHRQGLQITVKFGFPSVPDDVKQASTYSSYQDISKEKIVQWDFLVIQKPAKLLLCF